MPVASASSSIQDTGREPVVVTALDRLLEQPMQAPRRVETDRTAVLDGVDAVEPHDSDFRSSSPSGCSYRHKQTAIVSKHAVWPSSPAMRTQPSRGQIHLDVVRDEVGLSAEGRDVVVESSRPIVSQSQ